MRTQANQNAEVSLDADTMAMLPTCAEPECTLPVFSSVDQCIALTARKILQWLTELPADTIRITVENGWITLSGDVQHPHQQVAAALAVRNLVGVIGIFNHIQVGPNPCSDSIKIEIETTLINSALNDGGKITVSVAGSDVTLTGAIDSWTERSLARHSAWAASGVSHVVDNLTMSLHS